MLKLASARFDFDFAILTKPYRFHQIVKGYVRIVQSRQSAIHSTASSSTLLHLVIIDLSSTLHQLFIKKWRGKEKFALVQSEGFTDTTSMATLVGGALSGGISGKSGNTVFVQTAGGVVVRDRVIPFDPRTNLQLESRNRIRRASIAWQAMDPANVALWGAYADSLPRQVSASGQIRTPQPNNVFTSLYSKLLQLDITTPSPTTPPSTTLFGDSLSVKVEGLSETIRFTASNANLPVATTELLLQPLLGRNRRTYLRQYRSQAFCQFADGSLMTEIDCLTGWVACAYRFVNTLTGQSTPIAEAGVVWVS